MPLLERRNFSERNSFSFPVVVACEIGTSFGDFQWFPSQTASAILAEGLLLTFGKRLGCSVSGRAGETHRHVRGALGSDE